MRVTKEQLNKLNLSTKEFQKILDILKRTPNNLELEIFSVMWSEHCSYKSTKKWLKTLPTEAPWVICGPGENAGIIDIGDDDALVFKMESHNHPSFIEPYQGAATGVGGIMRDIFTMGARPIANLNSLRFGSPNNLNTKYLVNGVVSGVGDYGNCVGIPTVGGECSFHECYNNNILVNAMCVGHVKKNKIFYSAAKGENFPIIYVGAKTGRDGIHGATMASAEFDDKSSSMSRSQVQVGDPFTEKLLLEACLELMKTKAIIAIQDMGAAGLTSSSFEMASKGKKGINLHIENIPLRELGMMPYEIMLSETQERMLMIIDPDFREHTKKIFNKWGLESVEVGNLTDDGRMKIFSNGKIKCDLPIRDLVENAPEYNRPSKRITGKINSKFKKKEPLIDSFERIISNENFSDKTPLFSQYDSQVMGDTIYGPQDADSSLVRIHGTQKAVAITCDCNPIYCKSDPYLGSVIAVAESWRNLCAVGAKPMAITDNLNFGNPEKMEIMHEIKESIKGIAKACSVLNFPVISGNVSLYNDTNKKSIYPTPVIGGVGLIKDFKNIARINLQRDALIFGVGNTSGHLELSMFNKIVHGTEFGKPPEINLEEEKKNGEFIRNYICNYNEEVIGVHDISEGGIIVGLSEMVIKSQKGIIVRPPSNIGVTEWLFGEDQSRYIVVVKKENQIEKLSKKYDIYLEKIGIVNGDKLKIEKVFEISIKKLININKTFFIDYFD